MWPAHRTERVIDPQFATRTLHVDTTMNGNQRMFRANFADASGGGAAVGLLGAPWSGAKRKPITWWLLDG
jgi:hypothetical protein